MKVNLFPMPTVPTASPTERAEQRPVGRDSERYLEMIEELRALAIAADQLGVHSFSTTEHHLHTEGLEALPNPLLLFADLAARTERLVFAPTSIVLTPENPIRVAENIALLDLLTKGRIAVAFARGYQKRWVQVLGQGLTEATSTGDGGDSLNRERFEEFEQIVRLALTEDAFSFDGKYFQVPFPHAGIEGWPPVDYTRRYGADGEIDDDGVIRKIGVVPPPYSKPHPEFWVASAGSPDTIVHAAKNDLVPFLFSPTPEAFTAQARHFQDESAKAGRELKLGQRLGVTRGISIGRTREQAREVSLKAMGFTFHEYFFGFGFGELWRRPEETVEEYPVPFTLPDAESTTQRQLEAGFLLEGTADDLKRQIDDLHKVHADGELEYLCWMFNAQGLIPLEEQLEQLELYMNDVHRPLFG